MMNRPPSLASGACLAHRMSHRAAGKIAMARHWRDLVASAIQPRSLAPILLLAAGCAVAPVATRRDPLPLTASECQGPCRVIVSNTTGLPMDVSVRSAASSPLFLGTITGFRDQEFDISGSSVPMLSAKLRDGRHVRCARSAPRASGVVRLACGLAH